MGIVVKISVCYGWNCTYLVQTLDETEAKEKAYKMFRQEVSCCLPDTLLEAENDDRVYIQILAKVEHVLF